MKNYLSILSLGCAAWLWSCTATSSAQIVISEIHYHPVELPVFNTDGTPYLELTNDVHEFVEIQNLGPGAVDLGGWTLAGGVSYTFPTNTTIAAGAFRVVAKNPTRLAMVYSLSASDVLGPYSGYLGNGSDTVRLRDATGNAVDSVTYDSKFPWAQSADALGAQDRFTGLSATNYQYKGRSLQRVSVTWPSSDPANWLASPLTGPTPGSAQAVTRTIPKPVVIAYSAAQAADGATVIRASQGVTINCTYSATNSLSNVTLEYFLQNVNLTNQTRTTVAMTDLGGGKYSAAIPGQADRSIVRYRLKADRGDGLEVVSPRADDPQIAPTGAGGAFEAWWGYFVTPVRTTTNAATYDIFVSTGGLTRMSSNISQSPNRVTAASATGLPRDIPYVAATAPQWNGTVYGVFACNGEVYDIHIRYHGSRYHRAASNHSYKVHFPDHQPFNEQSSWFETLHGTEFIEGQKINRFLGLPSSKMRRVDWYLNSGSNEVHSEQGEYAGEMLDAWHELQQQLNPGSKKEETGELYKDVGNRDATQNNNEGPYTRGDLAPMFANSRWSQLDRYAWTFTLQNHDWKGPKPVRDVMEAMWTARGDSPSTHTYSSNSTTVPAVKLWYTNNWDIENTLTSMALLEWMSIWDDAAQNAFYWKRANGKWTRLGWDYDGVMSASSTSGGPGGGGAMGGTTNQTIYGGEYGAPTVFDGVNWWKDTFYKTFRAEYTKRLWELNNSFFDPTNLAALGLSTASKFAPGRRAYINTQLSALGTYYKPARPSNLYPLTGTALVSATNLVGSSYSHPQSTTHFASRWEIRSASGDYEEPILRITTTNSCLTNYPIPFDQLTYGQTYYWRVTYIDTNNHPSVVSAETSFSWGTTNSAAGSLVINEILAFNRNTIQNAGKYPDYIELRNNSSANLTLTGYALTDDPTNATKFTFPVGTTLIAGAYFLVWCDKETNAPGLHTGFGLNEEGETVLLMNGSTIVDSVAFGPQAPDVAIGRIINGTGGWQANTPTPGTANSAKTLGSVASLRVNEWMADPAYGEDWFELYNTDTNVVALGGLYLSDTPSTPTITQIPALSFIAGNGYTRFWADGKADGGTHANFKLSKSGESIVLTAANGATPIDAITFSAQTTDVSQGRLPDGSSTLASFTNTVSPGYCNWVPAPVCINELLANATAPLEDAVEIMNTNSTAVNIGGWWLSDDFNNRRKCEIPAGTTVPANGYVVFYSADLASGVVPFDFNASGDEAILSAVDGSGNLTGYGSLVRFGAAPENASFGRVTATGLSCSSGGTEFWPQTTHTFGQDNPATVAVFRTGSGAANASPKIGPLTINEIMYHPRDITNITVTATNVVDDTRDEYIELYNLSTNTVDLSGWRLKGDTEFVFPAGASLGAGGYLLLVDFDPADAATLTAFRTNYGLTTTVPIYGPYSEKLDNGAFDVEIAYPALVAGYTNYINVDKVEYRDSSPWPAKADGKGLSLQRASSGAIGNSAANWTANTPTPGAVNLGVITNVTIATASPLVGGLVGVPYTNSFTASGGTSPYSWQITAGSVPGLTLATTGVLSGTPTTANANAFTVQVTDSTGATASKVYVLVIAATAPSITTASALPKGAVGTAYSQTLAASGGTAPYTWAISTGTLPPGITFNSAGVISGTPTTNGTSTFTVLLTDSAKLTATGTFTLAVSVPELVITTVSPLVRGQQGTAYSQALTAAGGIPPYTWSLTSGTLPPGLTLSCLGDLSGTPTSPGVYTFAVMVTDSAHTAVTQALSLTVVSPALTILTEGLAGGTVGEAYAQTLEVTGGAMPYNWTLVWGSLPDGLNLSSTGKISGTPTKGGTFSFTVQAADSLGTVAAELLTIGIQNNPPTLSVQYRSASLIELLVDGDSGATYTLESSSNLVDWLEILVTNAPTTPFTYIQDTSTNSPDGYYRVRIDP